MSKITGSNPMLPIITPKPSSKKSRIAGDESANAFGLGMFDQEDSLGTKEIHQEIDRIIAETENESSETSDEKAMIASA